LSTKKYIYATIVAFIRTVILETMIRRLYRIILLIATNVLAFVLFTPLWKMLRPVRPLQQSMVDSAVRLWARLICSILGIRVICKGDVITDKGRFIVSNHLSYIDIPVLASLFNCVFVSKKEVRRWPIIGTLSALVGTVFVDRNSKASIINALTDAKRALLVNKCVVLFPEATTSNGKEIRPFKSSFFALPERLKIPIQPVAISYFDHDAWEKSEYVPWHGDMNILSHMWKITGLRGIRTVVTLCEIIKPNDSLSRKDLALIAEKGIKEAYFRDEP